MKFTSLCLLAVIGAVFLQPLYAVDIVDNGKFFSPDTIKTANQQISTLEAKHKTEIRIETFAAVPEADAARVQKMDKGERAKYFEHWLQTRAKEVGAKGAFLLICREPSHLRIDATRELKQRALNDRARTAVTDVMRASFGRKQFDIGLVAGLAALDQQLSGGNTRQAGAPAAAPIPGAPQRHVPAPPAAGNAGDSMTGWIWFGAIALGGFLLLRMVMNAIASSRQTNFGPSDNWNSRGGQPMNDPRGYPQGGPGPGGYPQGGFPAGGAAGGGFGRGLLGGLLGGAAGSYLYDQYGRSHGNSAQANDQSSHHHDQTHASNTDFGGGYSGGEDFGGSPFSGGGDFGGSDFGGGGDFGGGDGGGDF